MIINILKIAFISALPITELRGAIPIALTIYKMPVFPAYFFAVLGNIVPVIFLLLYLKPFSDFLCRWHFLNIFFKWLFERTHQYEEKFEKYGALFLLVFVAVPLPGTGAWTGSITAFVFGIRFWYAFPAIVGGIIIAGIVVTLTSLGIISFI
ncbi:MAG: small multi-drug export protein [Candidatus Atribacteria bacterium]|nr:small multi-drug export protein [Candidatus Atribacteria bacterium]